jgi:hypothetical protein
MRFRRTWLPVLAALVVLGLGTAGVARADDPPAPRPVVLSASSEPVGDLVPGGTGAAQFIVTNPNAFDVRLVSLAFDEVKSSSKPAACPTGLLTARDLRLTGGALVPASGKASFVVAGALKLSAEATDACLDVTFVVATRAQGVEDGTGGEAVPGTGVTSVPVTDTPVYNGSGISGDSASEKGGLAFTGVPVMVLVAGALVLLIAGIALRVLATRRKVG